MRYNIIIETEKDIEEIIRNKFKFEFKTKIIDIENVKETRTNPQNKSIHKFCTMEANELRDKSIPIYTVLTFRPETIWTMEMVKGIWRDIQFAEFGTRSTTELKKVGQIEIIHDVITKLIAESTKGQCAYIPFPSFDNMLIE